MPETQKTLRGRGFYVRMRFLHSTRYSRNLEKSFCYRFFRWILWFSVLSYFLTSFLVTRNKPTTSVSRAIVSPSKNYHSLVEETSHDSSAMKISSGLFKGLKVYVYDLPSKYNTAWLSNERCSSHLFASEVAIHRALISGEVRTSDPWEADFFFVPVYVSCNFSTVNGFPAIGHARSLISSAIKHVSSQLPFWNRSLGSDHVFVASHDFGSCFHTLVRNICNTCLVEKSGKIIEICLVIAWQEHVAMADGVPEFLKNSIILQTFGVTHKHPCQEVNHIVIPPYVSPESVRRTLGESPLTGRRDIFAYFRGKMEVHPKNVSGRFYSKQIRTFIWRAYGNDRRFYLRRHRSAGFQSEIVRSKFCLCPLGWAPWSPRLVESVALGCIPVIIADGIRLPFPSAVPWAQISLRVAENDVRNLGRVLENVAATNLTRIQRKLREPDVREALLFNDPMLPGDATWHVLLALSEKLHRSHKRGHPRVRF